MCTKHKSLARRKCPEHKSPVERHARSISLQQKGGAQSISLWQKEGHKVQSGKGDLKGVSTYHVSNTNHCIETSRKIMFGDE